MAKYLIEIDTDNAAFEDLEYELSSILRKAAKNLDLGILDFKLRDSNGNTVGSAYLEEDEDEDEDEDDPELKENFADSEEEEDSHGL